MAEYSAFSLLRHALTGHRDWRRAWRDPEPRKSYDVIIVGAGGHGMASAFYLAKNHNVGRIAVLEKGYLGGGNTGRNTTIVRSNYMLEEDAHFYEKSLQLWEQLSHELNFNVMFSQRGVTNLAHSDSQMDAFARRARSAMRLNGIDAELLDRKQVQREMPYLDFSENARFPIYGGLKQPRGGTARHDAVAWGRARCRPAGRRHHSELRGDWLQTPGNRITAVETTRGDIGCGKVGFAVAGRTGAPCGQARHEASDRKPCAAGLRLGAAEADDRYRGHLRGRAFLCQPVGQGRPGLRRRHRHVNSYAQRGNTPMIEHVMSAGLAMIPSLSRLRVLRHWGGIMDMSMDGSPIIGKSPIDNLYLNCGWCYGGFKATPGSGWVFAHTIANDAPHELNAGLNLERFRRGYLVDERGAGPYPNRH